MKELLFGILCYISGIVTIDVWQSLFQTKEQIFDGEYYSYKDFIHESDDKLWEEFDDDFYSIDDNEPCSDDKQMFYEENIEKYSNKLEQMFAKLK